MADVDSAPSVTSRTGVCLGFDIPDELLFKVRHASKRGTMDFEALAKTNDGSELAGMQALLATKYSHWKYEKEWRAFVGLDHATVTANGLYFMQFGQNVVLRQVIVGPNSTITRAEVAETLGDLQGVEAYKAQLAFNTFTVVRNRNAGLWK